MSLVIRNKQIKPNEQIKMSKVALCYWAFLGTTEKVNREPEPMSLSALQCCPQTGSEGAVG